MRRVLVLGRGGAGKSSVARRLGALSGLPVIELDALFWAGGPAGLSRAEWTDLQSRLIRADSWILDGDLGPYDVLDVRLRHADTVILLDFSLLRCAFRAVRRAREGRQFWWWVFGYRRRWLPLNPSAIARHAPDAHVIVFRGPRALRSWVAGGALDGGASDSG